MSGEAGKVRQRGQRGRKGCKSCVRTIEARLQAGKAGQRRPGVKMPGFRNRRSYRELGFGTGKKESETRVIKLILETSYSSEKIVNFFRILTNKQRFC